MLTHISVLEVEDILIDHFDMDIKLNDSKFYKSISNPIVTIFCINNEDIQNEINTYSQTESVGIPIINIEKKEVSILPSIINYISDKYDSYQLGQKLLVLISFGKAVKLVKPNSYCFILNDIGDKISFGKIENNWLDYFCTSFGLFLIRLSSLSFLVTFLKLLS